jgi:2-keto-4-pentenoate hydratase
VPGPEIANWQDVDLKAATAKLLLNGDVANQGVGADVLGDPVEALCWAANEANGIGLPLRNGDVITTGTMTGATLVNPSDQVVGDFGDLGQVALSF